MKLFKIVVLLLFLFPTVLFAGTPIIIIKLNDGTTIAATSALMDNGLLTYTTGGKKYTVEKSKILEIKEVIPNDVHSQETSNNDSSQQSYSNETSSNEMPDEILQTIKSNVAKRYPDNYSMQKILIEGQVKDYYFLQNYKPTNIPTNIFVRIKQKIENRYPYNYSMQKILIEGQVKDYLSLHN